MGLALFFGDGVLTPSISVLSAVEGLKVATPALEPYVLRLTLVLLIALFMVQRRGASRVGGYFGPIIIVWFSTIGLLGAIEVIRFPAIVGALDPRYGIDLILVDPGQGFVLLGSVVLAVTGAEALYADMGYFGPAPIRRAWLRFVFPALLLNYFGQGACCSETRPQSRTRFSALLRTGRSIRSSVWHRLLPSSHLRPSFPAPSR